MARPRSRHATRTAKKLPRWSRIASSFLAVSAGSAAVQYITAGTLRSTIGRIRGELVCSIDGAVTPGRLVDVALGVLLVPETQGTTVVASPITDDDAPWLLYERFSVGYEEMVTDVVAAEGLSVFRKSIDNKAMRILRPDVEAQLVIETATINGAASVNLVLHSSILFLDA